MLRDYQERAVSDLRKSLHRHRSALLVVPTGGGKTMIGSHIARLAVEKGNKVVWIAHRRELVHQAAKNISGCGIIMAGHERSEAPVQVCSVGTLVNRDRLGASLLVIDEAHHAVAKTWRQIIARFPEAKIVGLTATPQRSDGTALGDVFESLVAGPSIQELTNQGYLVPCDVIGPATRGKSLAMDPVEAWRKYAAGRQGFMFTRTIKQGLELVTQMDDMAIHIDGEVSTRVRDFAIKAFQAGMMRCLSSVQVFTEGTDLPMAGVAVLARGCSHPSTFIQMAGRILRPHPGKDRATLVDLCGVTHDHGLPSDRREYSLTGKPIRKVDALPAVRQCAACGAVWRAVPGETECQRCGHPLPALPPPVVKKRRMGALRPHAGAGERRLKWLSLLDEARARGYKRGWAAYKYKSIYGEWPR